MIETVLKGHARTVGDATVQRVLPFVFLDHMGPADGGARVGPHAHIGLATVTYLFEREIVHRDSLGSVQSGTR